MSSTEVPVRKNSKEKKKKTVQVQGKKLSLVGYCKWIVGHAKNAKTIVHQS